MKDGQDRKRERRALGLSVLLHGLAAPLFAAIVVGVDDLRPQGPMATTGLFSITVIHRNAPAPARPMEVHRAVERTTALDPIPARALRALPVSAVQRHTTGMQTKTRRVAVLAPLPTPVPTPTHRAVVTAVPNARTAAQTTTSAAPQPATTQKAAAVAQASPEPAPEPTPAAAAYVEAPAGGWGQNFREPMVLDDDALNALHARYHGAVAHIDVDEEGRATRVSVQGSGLDSDAVAALQRRLMDLRYVPAECNGLRCAAGLDLKV